MMESPGPWPEIWRPCPCFIIGSMLKRSFQSKKKNGPGFFRKIAVYRKSSGDFCPPFPKPMCFPPINPEMWIRGLNRAGVKKVCWIPSFPDVQQGFNLQSLQRKILDSENIPWLPPEKTIFPLAEDLWKARVYLRINLRLEETRPLWAIHPGSGSPHKNWPLFRFLETAGKLRDHQRIQPIFLSGPVEQETDSIFDLDDSNPGVPHRQEYILTGFGRCVVLLPRLSGQ